jgi:hypothetical protein
VDAILVRYFTITEIIQSATLLLHKSLDPSVSKNDHIIKLLLLYRAIRAVRYKSVAGTEDISSLASLAGASDVLKPICLAFARGYPSSPVGSWKTSRKAHESNRPMLQWPML